MSTSGTELRGALAQSVSVSDDALAADLADGRTITVPLPWFRRLAHGTPAERVNWRLIAGGEGIHWPDLDEDISVESLLAGRRSGETQESFRRWLQRRQLPRLFELRDLIADPASPDEYFQDFETRLQGEPSCLPVFVCWERKLQFLDEEAWKALKNEATPYLSRRDPRRGWQQLFDILGQADAYKYLRDIGCSEIRFIPRSDKEGRRTPDLEGLFETRRLLCEVKTINISDAEIRARSELAARGIERELDRGFFRKLQDDIIEAKTQLYLFDETGKARLVVYICIYFDDWAGYFKEAYFQQIDQYLKANPIPEIEVAFNRHHPGP